MSCAWKDGPFGRNLWIHVCCPQTISGTSTVRSMGRKLIYHDSNFKRLEELESCLQSYKAQTHLESTRSKYLCTPHWDRKVLMRTCAERTWWCVWGSDVMYRKAVQRYGLSVNNELSSFGLMSVWSGMIGITQRSFLLRWLREIKLITN